MVVRNAESSQLWRFSGDADATFSRWPLGRHWMLPLMCHISTANCRAVFSDQPKQPDDAKSPKELDIDDGVEGLDSRAAGPGHAFAFACE